MIEAALRGGFFLRTHDAAIRTRWDAGATIQDAAQSQ
jgi:hypothetical protein